MIIDLHCDMINFLVWKNKICCNVNALRGRYKFCYPFLCQYIMCFIVFVLFKKCLKKLRSLLFYDNFFLSVQHIVYRGGCFEVFYIYKVEFSISILWISLIGGLECSPCDIGGITVFEIQIISVKGKLAFVAVPAPQGVLLCGPWRRLYFPPSRSELCGAALAAPRYGAHSGPCGWARAIPEGGETPTGYYWAQRTQIR